MFNNSKCYIDSKSDHLDIYAESLTFSKNQERRTQSKKTTSLGKKEGNYVRGFFYREIRASLLNKAFDALLCTAQLKPTGVKVAD